MTTQCERITAHLLKRGSITQQDATELYGIMRLGARIYDLRRRGHRIDRVLEDGVNRYGERTRYARYIYRGGGDG